MSTLERNTIIMRKVMHAIRTRRTRDTIYESEACGVTDHMGMEGNVRFMNKFEFCKHLADRWHIDEASALTEFNDMLKQKEIPQSVDEKGYPTLCKYGYLKFKKGRDLQHTHQMHAGVQSHDNTDGAAIGRVASGLGAGTLAKEAGIWDMGSFNSLAGPTGQVLDRGHE